LQILCFADTRFPIERANGVQTFETCHALARRGHSVTLLTRPDSAPVARDPFRFYGRPPEPRLRIDTVPARGPARARRLRYLLATLRLASSAREAVIFTRDAGVAAWLLQLPKSRRPAVIYESHGLAPVVAAEMPALLGKPELAPSPAKLRRLERREQRIWKHARAYVSITQALARELERHYGPRDSVFVVPDGAKSLTGVPAPRSDRFVAGYAGHLYPWKGVDVFVQALTHAPEVHGLIVGGHPGEADLQRVTTLVRERGLTDRVTITGLVSPSDVAYALAPASALVLPNTQSAISERYTSPLKLFEYLSMGRAIIASDFPSIREILTDGRTARLVPAGDSHALGAALMKLRRDATLTAALAGGAAALAPEYTWERRAERLEAALEAARES